VARIAIVVPRCAETAYGGAEALALQVAIDLRGRHDVEIITTCASDYWTWENVLPEGVSDFRGIPTRRFAVDEPRHIGDFDRLSRSFRYRIADLTPSDQERWIRAQGPYSSALFAYLFKHRTAYDAFVFMPYLYATTYFGLPIVRDRSVLLPLAHDEWPLYFNVWSALVRDARVVLPITSGEAALLRRRFPTQDFRDEILQPAILAAKPSAAGAGAIAPRSPFALYLGRVDDSKGLVELRQRIAAHRHAHPDSPWHVVVAGPGPAGRDDGSMSFTGAVDEATKWQLLRACDLFVMPSLHESLSIAMIEAWSEGKATLVDARNTVLVEQTRRAQGGLWYYDDASFDAALAALDAPLRAALGRQGRDFVERTYAEGNVAEIFERALPQLL
jgi:glycosyltransferase involved in cell wall biosynthesis